MSRRWRTGILGCGDIASRYVRSLLRADSIELVAAASRSPASAQRVAQMFGGRAMTEAALLADPTLEAVVILSPPQHHEQAIARALDNGLNVYCEKPFALGVTKAAELIGLAESNGVMLAAAPAVHLGPSLGRARTLIDAGAIGTVIGGAATLVYPGPDLWHHNPDHLFAAGGGPLWDMGVYHLSALVFLLGPVVQVQAVGTRAFPSRTIRQGPRSGEVIPVEVATHIVALASFACGAEISLTFSFDGFGSRAPGIEIYGTQGALALGHPNDFAAPVHLSTEVGKWEALTETGGWHEDMWAIGPIEALAAHSQGREPRASAHLATHVIDVMTAIERLCHEGTGTAARIPSQCRQPEPLVDYDGLGWQPAGRTTAAGTRQ